MARGGHDGLRAVHAVERDVHLLAQGVQLGGCVGGGRLHGSALHPRGDIGQRQLELQRVVLGRRSGLGKLRLEGADFSAGIDDDLAPGGGEFAQGAAALGLGLERTLVAARLERRFHAAELSDEGLAHAGGLGAGEAHDEHHCAVTGDAVHHTRFSLLIDVGRRSKIGSAKLLAAFHAANRAEHMGMQLAEGFGDDEASGGSVIALDIYQAVGRLTQSDDVAHVMLQLRCDPATPVKGWAAETGVDRPVEHRRALRLPPPDRP